MSYPDSVRYLYALGNELRAGTKFGLDRMRILLEALGHPEQDQQFVHVAGTNGKGSTCAMIASIVQQAGKRTGLYTSPHLVEPTERIQIDGKPVSTDQFASAYETVHAAAEKLLQDGAIEAHPSYFETVTAMGLLVFRKRAEISVIEVGLGGRLDATNVIVPRLSVITPVSYDHEAYLGNTLDLIAGEKAGILKPGVPVVVAAQEVTAENVISTRAGELGCPLIRPDFGKLQVLEARDDGSRFRYEGAEYECLLPGRHQIGNAVCAILACRELQIEGRAIAEGLRQARWPGRLERVSHDPDFVLDGAHNPAGAAALAAYIREFCPGREVWMVYGAMRDKAIEEVTEQLFPLAKRLILTVPDFPRALRAEAILEVTPHLNAGLTENVPQAIELARKAPPGAIVFFTGSLYLVGEARKLLVQ
ncbi:MAG TPA: folylpolyglutamate synthase/dihydrofolate synthase family protein [Bryobacteraceae bacterium]